MAAAQAKKVALLLPVDHVVGKEFSAEAESKNSAGAAIEDGWLGMDIGPATVKKFKDALAGAKTVFWNGPMGVFEFPKFAVGTTTIADDPGRASGRDHGDRRRRFGVCGQKSRRCREDVAYFDRRRRIARTGRGQGTAGYQGAERQVNNVMRFAS